MRILETRGESNLSELARRLFEIEGPRAAAEEKRAIAALRDANPHLRASAALPAGTPLAVPEVEGLKPRRAASASLKLPEHSTKQLRDALSRAGEVMAATLADEKDRDDEMIRLVKEHKAELKSAGREVAERLEKISQATAARRKNFPEQSKLQKQSFAELQKDLDILLQALGQ